MLETVVSGPKKVHVDGNTYYPLLEKYPGYAKKLREYVEKEISKYQKYPFKQKTKELFIQEIKETVTLVNPNGDSNIKEDLAPEQFNEDELRREILTSIIIKNEDKATELIAKEVLRTNYIYSTRDDIKSEIWFYDDGIYLPNGKSKIKIITRHFLGEAYTPLRVKNIIAKVEADTFIEVDEFFNQEYLDELPVKNGILNLRSQELSSFTPKKIFFNKIPVTFDPEKECPNIKKFFKSILKSKDDSKVLFELIGYSLWKDHFIEKAFMFLGEGRNGKGKTLSLIKSFLGTVSCCSVPLNQMRSDSTSVCELHGKFVNIAGDLDNTALKQTGMFKGITGRDPISAKRKYLRDLFFVNYSKQIFACNELPRVYDLSTGFWSRWILLEFPYTFIPEEHYNSLPKDELETYKIQDTDIIQKLTTPEELSGLLNEAIKHLLALLDKKDFSYSIGTQEVKDLWIRKSDSFTAYCLDNLKEDLDGYIIKKDLRKSFYKYCKKHKLKSASDISMKITLENMFGVMDSQKDVGFNRERVWEGIEFSK